MSAILLNSGGGIHVDDGNILLADPLSPEDCECCGPPQPPPPDCGRCPTITGGVLSHHLPTEYDLALQISDVTDQYKYIFEQEYDSYTPPGPNCFDCTTYHWSVKYDIEINGFAGLNGTYYFAPKISSPAQQSSLINCNPDDLAFDPFALPDSPFCADPICERQCTKNLWIKDIALTGHYKCTSIVSWSCFNGAATYFKRVLNIPLTGWANIFTNAVFIAGEGLPLILSPTELNTPNGSFLPRMYGYVAGSQAASDYSPGASIALTWVEGRTGFEGSCTALVPGFNQTPTSCPLPQSLIDLDCYPYWRLPMFMNSVVCAGDPPISPTTTTHIYDKVGCSDEDSVSTSGEGSPACGPSTLVRKGLVSFSPFYAKFDFIWSLA